MKQKTRKAVAKKFHVTKGGKVMRRYTKQNHGNSKETGTFRRKKRQDQSLNKTDAENVLKSLPYA